MAMITAAAAFANITFDYLIAGGGTAGLVLANRLSENASVTVGVIEAGVDKSADPKVVVPGLWASQIGDPAFDWNYTTVPQLGLDGRTIPATRGKQLGGSSGINAMQHLHANALDLDDWEALGNYGWNYDIMKDYYRKFENYQAPPDAQVKALGLEYIDPIVHGFSGPINTSIPSTYYPVQADFVPTYDSLGLKVNGDPYGGQANGAFSSLMFVDAKSHRSYAANRYLLPVTQRKNLFVTTGALVHNVTFASPANTTDSASQANDTAEFVATGLFYSANGQVYHASATREVILSGGVYGSPHILERSGIGSRKILEQNGIPVLVENPNVGENLQDQTIIPATLKSADYTPATQSIEESTLQCLVNGTGPLANGVYSSALLSYDQILAASQKGRPQQLIDAYLNGSYEQNRPGLQAQFKVLQAKLTNPNDTVAQIAFSSMQGVQGPPPADGSFDFAGISFQHPFSRGSSHIASADPNIQPTIDPGYHSHPIDLQILVDIFAHTRLVFQTPPLSTHFVGNGTILDGTVGLFNSSAEVEAYIKEKALSFYHGAGTCAMQPREKDGVVSPRLIVYGTKNLRVVDLSIAPILPRGNPTSLVYALAEKAADMIKIYANTTIPGVNSL